MPMRPQPMTPTLISFSSDPESAMERADRVRKEAADEAEGAKASVEAAQARKRRVEKRIVAGRGGGDTRRLCMHGGARATRKQDATTLHAAVRCHRAIKRSG